MDTATFTVKHGKIQPGNNTQRQTHEKSTHAEIQEK